MENKKTMRLSTLLLATTALFVTSCQQPEVDASGSEEVDPTWLVRTRAVLDGSSSLWDWDEYGIRYTLSQWLYDNEYVESLPMGDEALSLLGIDDPQSIELTEQMSQYIGLALSAFSNDMTELADHYCNQAISLDSLAWKPYAIKGLILDEQQDVHAAIDCYGKAHELNANRDYLLTSEGDTLNYPMLMNRLAKDLAQAGQYQESIILLQEILMQEPQNLEALNSLVSVYARDKQYAKAEKWANKLLATHQDDLLAYTHLATLALQQGHKPQAIECYEKCLEIDPENADAINALYNLYLYGNRARALELKKRITRS